MRFGVVVAALVMGAAAGVLPARAEEARPAVAPEVALNELTAQYTLLFRLKRYFEAAEAAQEAVSVAEQGFGPDDARVAQALNDLGRLLQLQDRHAEAVPLHQRALAIREKRFAPDDAAVEQSLSNLATAYRAEGRVADAEPLLKRALAILEQHLGPEHPRVAGVLVALAQDANAQGKGEEAAPLFRRALAIWEAAPESSLPEEMMAVLVEYAALLRRLGQEEDAAAVEAKAARLREEPPAPNNSP